MGPVRSELRSRESSVKTNIEEKGTMKFVGLERDGAHFTS